jgi:hypothetical protein
MITGQHNSMTTFNELDMTIIMVFSWEPALETVMSVDRVMLLRRRSKKNH